MSNNQQNTNNIDDDLKKYIFEPENPKDFLIYKLLLKIIKERKNQVMFDLNFIYEIFKDRIFDREVEEKLWDKPENYHCIIYRLAAKRWNITAEFPILFTRMVTDSNFMMLLLAWKNG